MNDLLATLTEALTDQQTYVQVALILVSLFAGQIVAGFIRRRLNILKQPPADATGPNLQLTV